MKKRVEKPEVKFPVHAKGLIHIAFMGARAPGKLAVPSRIASEDISKVSTFEYSSSVTTCVFGKPFPNFVDIILGTIRISYSKTPIISQHQEKKVKNRLLLYFMVMLLKRTRLYFMFFYVQSSLLRPTVYCVPVHTLGYAFGSQLFVWERFRIRNPFSCIESRKPMAHDMLPVQLKTVV